MRHSLAVFLLLTLVACSSDSPPNGGDSGKTVSAEEMYKDAKESLNKENYETAIKKFESLQARYPYGRYAQQALLEVAYAYYKQNDAESAISAIPAAERFIKQHPNNPHVDYAYYVKGLANFSGGKGLLDSLSRQDQTERDLRAAQDSFDAFKDHRGESREVRLAEDARR